MGQPGQFDALERAVEGSLAEGTLQFDGDASVLRIDGYPIQLTGWLLSLGIGGAALLLTGAVLSLGGLTDAARWALAPGAALLGAVLVPLALLRLTPVAALWPELELRFTERALVHRRTRVPFGDLRPEHLVWKNGWFIRRLCVRHPSLRKQLAGFLHGDERQAAEFQRRLWDLISAPDPPGVLAGAGLSPVQQWIIGASAPHGAVNGFRHDRLGIGPSEIAAADDRRTALELLHDRWDVYDLEQLLAAVNWLVQDGHRADFAQDAELAARPAADREEYAELLREVDDFIARDLLEPPFVERLIALVRVRYGDHGDARAALVPPLLRDEPGADLSEQGAELAQFLHRLFNDRGHVAGELHRLKTLADLGENAGTGRFLIWDYGRALMLYRWGHMVGWLAEEYCWERMLPLAVDIQRNYTSWRDMAACHLQGRLLWSGGGGQAQGENDRIVDRLERSPLSPWNIVRWDLDLTRDWP